MPLTCAPSATRTRDLRRHSRNVASDGSAWPHVQFSDTRHGWTWPGAALRLWSLAPRLAPGISLATLTFECSTPDAATGWRDRKHATPSRLNPAARSWRQRYRSDRPLVPHGAVAFGACTTSSSNRRSATGWTASATATQAGRRGMRHGRREKGPNWAARGRTTWRDQSGSCGSAYVMLGRPEAETYESDNPCATNRMHLNSTDSIQRNVRSKIDSHCATIWPAPEDAPDQPGRRGCRSTVEPVPVARIMAVCVG
jgi:hypothetical protein